MNRELLARALEQVKRAPQGDASALDEESAGVLREFVEARGKAGSISAVEKALHEKINAVLAALEAPGESAPNGVDDAGPAAGSSGDAKPAEISNRLDAANAFSKGHRAHMSILEGISTDISVRSFEYEGETLVTGDVPGDVGVTRAE